MIIINCFGFGRTAPWQRHTPLLDDRDHRLDRYSTLCATDELLRLAAEKHDLEDATCASDRPIPKGNHQVAEKQYESFPESHRHS